MGPHRSRRRISICPIDTVRVPCYLETPQFVLGAGILHFHAREVCLPADPADPTYLLNGVNNKVLPHQAPVFLSSRVSFSLFLQLTLTSKLQSVLSTFGVSMPSTIDSHHEPSNGLLELPSSDGDTSMPIAVIGIGGRFPDSASDPEKLWELLSQGRSALREVPKDRFNIDAFYHLHAERQGTVWSSSLFLLHPNPSVSIIHRKLSPLQDCIL